jgi:neuronal calcium sensor 1
MGNKNDKFVATKKLTKKDIKNLMKSTGMTEEEIVSIFESFKFGNLDGKLDRNQFAKLYLALRKEPVGNLDEITDFCFRGFDLDNSGCLSFHEFAMGYGITTNGKPEDKLAYAFDIYDLSGDGSLNSNEIRQGLIAMLNLIGSRQSVDINALTQECMEALDYNRDNFITKDEFITGLIGNYTLRVVMSPFN